MDIGCAKSGDEKAHHNRFKTIGRTAEPVILQRLVEYVLIYGTILPVPVIR